MIPSGLLPIANHLWQSTLFAGIAGLLTLLLRQPAHSILSVVSCIGEVSSSVFAACSCGHSIPAAWFEALRPRACRLSSSR